MTFDPEAARRRHEFARLLDASSIGRRAWCDCPVHGRTARDPDTGWCVECGL